MYLSINFVFSPLNQQSSCDDSITTAVLISVLVNFVTTLGVSAVLSSVITYYITSHEVEQPVYEEASVSVSREDNIKMGENVAYGPVVR